MPPAAGPAALSCPLSAQGQLPAVRALSCTTFGHQRPDTTVHARKQATHKVEVRSSWWKQVLCPQTTPPPVCLQQRPTAQTHRLPGDCAQAQHDNQTLQPSNSPRCVTHGAGGQARLLATLAGVVLLPGVGRLLVLQRSAAGKGARGQVHRAHALSCAGVANTRLGLTAPNRGLHKPQTLNPSSILPVCCSPCGPSSTAGGCAGRGGAAAAGQRQQWALDRFVVGHADSRGGGADSTEERRAGGNRSAAWKTSAGHLCCKNGVVDPAGCRAH